MNPSERVKERTDLQSIPLKIYRTARMLTVAAPMPGLDAKGIRVVVTAGGVLELRGLLRGGLKGRKQVLVEEWSVGPYHRSYRLPMPVNGNRATVTYGNGVLVVALPITQVHRAAQLRLTDQARSRHTATRQ